LNLKNWLLAYEFPDTILILDSKRDTMFAYCSPKKASLLEQLNTLPAGVSTDKALIKVQAHTRPKGANDEEARKTLDAFLEKALKENNVTTVGYFAKDKYDGNFIGN
jgi:nucleosome binding factor SPN SPT16 subunit